MVRGHLELSGITTVEALAGDHAGPGAGGRRPGRPAARRASPSRAAIPPGPSRPSGWPAACWPACTATPGGPGGSPCSRPRPRTSCGSCCDGSTWRPAPSLPATPAWPRSSSSSRATKRRRSRGSPSCWRAASVTTRPPGWTAGATTARWPGCGWPRGPAARSDGPAAAPSKATPIAVVFRSDLDWLLEAARAAGPHRLPPTVGATAEIIEVLGRRARPSPPTWPRPPAACPTTSSGACGRA